MRRDQIKAITFDVGGTLIDPWPSVGAAYASVAERFGIQCCPDTVTRRFIECWQTRENFCYTRAEWQEVVCHSFRGQAEISDEIFKAIYDHFGGREPWLIYEDVIPALERAEEAGLKLAVISNWDERLEPLLEKLGLRAYFSHVIVSALAGAHKPDRRIFHGAARLLGCNPGEILHVGDSLREDIQGATQAGFSALRIRRSGPSACGEVERLTDILPK